jgi:hypothetical protein
MKEGVIMTIKNNYIARPFLTLFLLVITITLSGCQPNQNTPNAQALVPVSDNSEIVNIQVKTVSAQKIPGDTEDFPLPNCGGTGNLSQTLGTQVSVSKTVELGASVKVNGGGQIGISEAASVLIEAAVEANYKQEYDKANSRLDTIEMVAAPKTHVIYTIAWEKQVFSSVITFELDTEVIETPYIFTMNVPKIAGSHEKQCPEIGLVNPPTPIAQNEANIDKSTPMPSGHDGPFRPHYQVVVGDGIFAEGTFSDGLAEYTQDWLWSNGHGDIQQIRIEEYPNGCDISRHNTNLVWISGTSDMKFSVNDEIVGTYKIADNSHGYIFQWPIKIGDKLCAVNFKTIGYSILLGPNIYYHYDSYCYRGNC